MQRHPSAGHPGILVTLFLTLIPCFLSLSAEASLRSVFALDSFSRQTGLNAAMMKSVTVDAEGRLLVGADNDVYYFDGLEWVPVFRDRPDIRVKLLVPSHTGSILALCDFGLYRLSWAENRYIPSLLLDLKESEGRYAKSLIEVGNTILLASDNRVVRLQEGRPLESQTLPVTRELRSYLHSVFFLNTDHEFPSVITHAGELLTWHEGKYVLDEEWEGPHQVNGIWNRGDNTWILGTERGIERVTENNGTFSDPVVLLSLPGVSAFVFLENDMLLAGLQNRELRFYDLKNEIACGRLISRLPGNIFRMIPDHNRAVWMVTETQILRAEVQPVTMHPASNASPFLSSWDDQSVLFADGNKLLKASENGHVSELSDWPSSISFALRDQDIVWVALQNGALIQADHEGNPLAKWDLGTAAASLFLDSQKNLWATPAGSPGIQRIQPSDAPGTFTVYGSDVLPAIVSCMIENKSGELFIASSGIDQFLWKWEPAAEGFINIGKAPSDRVNPEVFGINDMAIDAQGNLILASTQGLLRFHADGCLWDESGDYNLYEVLAHRITPQENHTWSATYSGILQRRAASEEWMYDTYSGLDSMISTNRNLQLTRDMAWIGTQDGLASIPLKAEPRNSSRPYLRSFIHNGRVSNHDIWRLGNEDNVVLQFKSPDLPSNTVRYRFTLSRNNERESIDTIEEYSGVYTPSFQQPGRYQLLVESKREGFFYWSEPLVLEWVVYSSSAQRWLLMASILLALTGLFWFILWDRRKKHTLHIQKLNQLVCERTADIQEKNAELEQSNRVRERMISIISHDIRGSLGSMASLLDLSCDPMQPKGSEQRESDAETWELLHRETQSAYQTLENLLAWAMHQQGALAIAMDVVNLNSVLDSIHGLFSSRLQIKAIGFTTAIAVPMVQGNPHAIETVLRNLVGNAVKFCHCGDSITVSSSHQYGRVLISVSDTGPGIPKEIQQKIFSPKLGFTTRGSLNESGSGLGLAVVSELLELMNSELTLVSEPGKGSVFSFTLESIP